jgi:hypothetical protein
MIEPNLLEQWVREETLVRITFVDGEELVSKGYIRASPLDCFISHVRPEGVYVREGGTLWLFRFSRVGLHFAQTPLDRPFCPTVTSITPIENEFSIDPSDKLLADHTTPDGVRHVTVQFGMPVNLETLTLDTKVVL